MDISICPKEVFPNGSSIQGDYRRALEVYKRAAFGIIELRKQEKIEYFEANSFKNMLIICYAATKRLANVPSQL